MDSLSDHRAMRHALCPMPIALRLFLFSAFRIPAGP
jgi:hypothetical protein